MSNDLILAELPERIERASKYLAKMDLSIEGQHGNDQLFTAATALAYRFDLPEETAVEMLQNEFNPRCSPPWSEKEIRKAVADANTKAHDKPRGDKGMTGQRKRSTTRSPLAYKQAPKAKATASPATLSPSTNGTATMDFRPKWEGYQQNFLNDSGDDLMIAKIFGVPADCLRTLGCLGKASGVTSDGKGSMIFTGMLYWPEEDGNGNIIGLSYRNCQTNDKRAMKGAKRGITLPPGWDKRPGPLLVTEGFSDLVALHATGMNSISRPSKSLAAKTSAGFLANALSRTENNEIIILADKDDATTEGNAAQIAAILKEQFPNRSICWAILPDDAKDPREWLTTPDDPNQPWQERGEAFLNGIVRQAAPLEEEAEDLDAIPEPIPLGKLIEKYPELLPVIIEGLLREGETMNVIAAPKTGKSWLVCDLALAIATGRDWLGKFPTRKGKVLVIDNELHPETSADRFPLVGEARGISLDECQNEIEVCNLRGCLRPLDEMDSFFDRIEPGKYQIIILDAMYRFQSGDASENDNAAMTQMYNAIDRYALRLNCGFILIHHTSKGSQGEKSVVDVGSGAGSQSRAADTHLVLREHQEKGCVVLDANNRSFAPIEPLGLRFSFPVWNVDESLDVTELKTQYRRGAARATSAKEEPIVFGAADKPEWDSEYIAKQVERYGQAGIGRQTLIDLVAKGAEVTTTKASRMILKACEPGIATIQKVQVGRNAPAAYVATCLLKSVESTALAFVEESENKIPETFKPNKE